MKTIIILIGQKGSGKTFIAQMLNDKLNIPFIRIEQIFLKIKKDHSIYDKDYIREGFTLFENELRIKLNNCDVVCFESTGTAPEFDDLLERLRKEFQVKLIKIDADPKLCLKRVRERDRLAHIPVSDDDVLNINEISRKKHYKYDGIIDNDSKTAEQIIEDLRKIIDS